MANKKFKTKPNYDKITGTLRESISVSLGTIDTLPAGYGQKEQKLKEPLLLNRCQTNSIDAKAYAGTRDEGIGPDLSEIEAKAPKRSCKKCKTIMPPDRYFYCHSCRKYLPPDDGDWIYYATHYQNGKK